MSIGLVDSFALVGASTQTSSSRNFTGASLIVAALAASIQDLATSPMSDSLGNSYSAATRKTSTGSAVNQQFYAINPTVSSSMTVTSTYSSQFVFTAVLAFSGINTSTPFDMENGAVEDIGATTLSCGTITPTAGDLLVAGIGYGSGTGSLTIDNGLSITNQSPLVGGSNYAGGAAWKEHTSGSINVTWTSTVGMSSAAATITAFKAAAAAAAAAGNTLPMMGIG